MLEILNVFQRRSKEELIARRMFAILIVFQRRNSLLSDITWYYQILSGKIREGGTPPRGVTRRQIERGGVPPHPLFPWRQNGGVSYSSDRGHQNGKKLCRDCAKSGWYFFWTLKVQQQFFIDSSFWVMNWNSCHIRQVSRLSTVRRRSRIRSRLQA